MRNKYFCAIFIIGYNLISYTNNDHIRTGPVSLQISHGILQDVKWAFMRKRN